MVITKPTIRQQHTSVTTKLTLATISLIKTYLNDTWLKIKAFIGSIPLSKMMRPGAIVISLRNHIGMLRPTKPLIMTSPAGEERVWQTSERQK